MKNMLLHVSTFKISSSGNSLCLAKIKYRFLGTGKIKLLKYKLLIFINLYFNNFTSQRPKNLYVILARHNEFPEDDILNVESCRSMLFVIVVFDIFVHLVVKL